MPASLRLSIASKSLLLVAVLLSAFIFISSAVPYLMLDAKALSKFEGRQAGILVHVFTASVALLLGPVQIWMGQTGRSGLTHRRLGFMYIAGVIVSSCTAFYLAVTIDGPWGQGAGLFATACVWLFTIGNAIIAVRRRDFDRHKLWMIRNYVVTLSFVFFRVMMLVGTELKIGTWDGRLVVFTWASWTVPLLITEIIIRKQASNKGLQESAA